MREETGVRAREGGEARETCIVVDAAAHGAGCGASFPPSTNARDGALIKRSTRLHRSGALGGDRHEQRKEETAGRLAKREAANSSNILRHGHSHRLGRRDFILRDERASAKLDQ